MANGSNVSVSKMRESITSKISEMEERYQVRNEVWYRINSFFRQQLGQLPGMVDGLSEKTRILKLLEKHNSPREQEQFLKHRATYGYAYMKELNEIIRHMIFQTGTEEEQELLGNELLVERLTDTSAHAYKEEREKFLFLRKMEEQELKEFGKRLQEYEILVKKEIDNHLAFKKHREDSNGSIPFLPYVGPDTKIEYPAIGLVRDITQNYLPVFMGGVPANNLPIH